MSTDVASLSHEAPPPGEPNLDSFVLRFVRAAEGSKGWHGVIRHVQSNRERAFNRWDDAVSFINEFVTLGEPDHE